MAASNPLSRKRLRDEARRQKRVPDGMVVDDEDTPSNLGGSSQGFTFKPTYYAALAEEVPLPDEDEEL